MFQAGTFGAVCRPKGSMVRFRDFQFRRSVCANFRDRIHHLFERPPSIVGSDTTKHPEVPCSNPGSQILVPELYSINIII